MKIKIYSLLASLLVTLSVWAQAPQKMSYQAVIRNSSNALLTSTPVGMQISILQGSSTGTAVYVETQTVSTNANGLVNLEIGTGAVITGTFATINWANGPYFIKTETDITGGTNYTISGTSELMSVPYALFSANVAPKIYTIGLWPELGGYVFRVSADGKHGLVAETQDQSTSSDWYTAQDTISNPSNPSTHGQNYTDWRMPTKYELNEMYLQLLAIGGFGSGNYWSSTESDYGSAWYQNFAIGYQLPTDRFYNYSVRSVRAF